MPDSRADLQNFIVIDLSPTRFGGVSPLEPGSFCFKGDLFIIKDDRGGAWHMHCADVAQFRQSAWFTKLLATTWNRHNDNTTFMVTETEPADAAC